MPWPFYDCHFAYNSGVALLLSGVLDQEHLDNEREALIDNVKAILIVLSSGGNESAASCRSILDWLSPIAKVLGADDQTDSESHEVALPPDPWTLPLTSTDFSSTPSEHDWNWQQLFTIE